MKGQLREHLRSNVVSYVALFCFAAGGIAQASDGPLAGTNTVGSEDIIGNEVKSGDIGDGRIFNIDFANDVIESGKIRDGTLLGADVGAGTLSSAHIDESSLFNDNSLTTDDIDESTLFGDNSLTQADLGANSIGAPEVATSSVGTSEVTNTEGVNVQETDLAINSAGSSELGAGAVTASELTEVSIARRDDDLAPFETKDFLTTCPEGNVIGGDPFNVTPDVRLNASFPSESTTEINFPENGEAAVAWWTRYQNVGPFFKNVTSFVICVESS